MNTITPSTQGPAAQAERDHEGELMSAADDDTHHARIERVYTAGGQMQKLLYTTFESRGKGEDGLGSPPSIKILCLSI